MRKMADCRRFESDNGCTLTIIGEEEEVLDAAAQHAVAVGRTIIALLENGQLEDGSVRLPAALPAHGAPAVLQSRLAAT